MPDGSIHPSDIHTCQAGPHAAEADSPFPATLWTRRSTSLGWPSWDPRPRLTRPTRTSLSSSGWRGATRLNMCVHASLIYFKPWVQYDGSHDLNTRPSQPIIMQCGFRFSCTQVGSEPLPKASGWIPKDVVRLVQVWGVDHA